MRRSDHFKLGIFVLVGVFLLLVVLLVLGGGNLFRKTYRFETYLDEAVSGLAVGSPVRYRGVDVGSVMEIGFVTSHYVDFDTSEQRYVYVIFEMDADLFSGSKERDLKRSLTKDIQRGLRVRPVSQGLTGQLFLDIDYLSPAANPVLPISWEPKQFYIPSAASTLSRLEAAVTSVAEAVGGLEKEVISRFLNSLANATESLATFLETADAKSIGELVQANLGQTEQMFANINRLLASPSLEQLVPEVHRLLASVNEIIDRGKEHLLVLVEQAALASTSVASASARVDSLLQEPGIREGLAQLPESFERVNSAVAEFEAGSASFRDAMARINSLVADQQLTIRDILETVRDVAQNLRELSDEAKRNPSGVLFGQPPQQVLPEQ